MFFYHYYNSKCLIYSFIENKAIGSNPNNYLSYLIIYFYS